MPWTNGNYPPAYKNQPIRVGEKSTEIANAVLAEEAEEGIAIATSLKKARESFESEQEKEKMKKG